MASESPIGGYEIIDGPMGSWDHPGAIGPSWDHGRPSGTMNGPGQFCLSGIVCEPNLHIIPMNH